MPWDQAAKDEASFFEVLDDGLVTVVADEDPAAGPTRGPERVPGSHVGADGSVTAFTGKVEAGQGTRTALGLLVAEELAVPPGSVRVVMGSTDVSPFDLGTFGSRSMPYAAPPLRSAAAAARELLREAAAARFGLPPADLTVGAGMVAGPGRRAEHRLLRPADRGAPGGAGTRRRAGDPRSAWRSAGRPVPAARGAEVVTGVKHFPSDLRFDGMRHGCVLRAPAFGATLRSADTARAEALPGVSVVSGRRVHRRVAGSRDAARRARRGHRRVLGPHAPSPARMSWPATCARTRSTAKGSGATFRHEQGDVDAALAAGPGRLDGALHGRLHRPRPARAPRRPWRVAGRPPPVWTGTSTPFRARARAGRGARPARRTGSTSSVPDYGGGFGGKHGSAVAVEAARLARAARRPGQGPVEPRTRSSTGATCGPPRVIDVSASADAVRRLTGWSHLNVNSGAVGIMTPYRVPHQRIVFQPAESPLPPGLVPRAGRHRQQLRARSRTWTSWRAGSALDPVEFRLAHLDDEPARRRDRAAAGRLGWAAAWPGPAA